jgi:hypothetical protein
VAVAGVASGVAQLQEGVECTPERLPPDTELPLELGETRPAALGEERERRGCPPVVEDVEVEDRHEIEDMVRLSTFYDADGTPWMLGQTLDDKSSRR